MPLTGSVVPLEAVCGLENRDRVVLVDWETMFAERTFAGRLVARSPELGGSPSLPPSLIERATAPFASRLRSPLATLQKVGRRRANTCQVLRGIK